MRRTRITILIMGLISIVSLAGCGSSDQITVPADNRGIQADTTPALADMEQVLQAELARLGKSTMQAGEYVPPSGDINIPFDLHAQVIDPDGAGGADPLGVHVTWTERLVGDYNMDGLVNASDLTSLGQYYNQTVDYRDAADVGGVEVWPPATAYDLLDPNQLSPWRLARIDGNGDGLINMQDITSIGQHWQEQIDSYTFMIWRDGEEPGLIYSTYTGHPIVRVTNGVTPLSDMHGDYWPNVPKMYEVNLPVSVEPGDQIIVLANCGNGGELEYPVECTRENPRWHTGAAVQGSQLGLKDAFVVQTLVDEEPTGYVAYASEYLRGDLDGNGISHPIESSLLYEFNGANSADYEEPLRSVIDRIDWNLNGMPEVSDITPVGYTTGRRLVGLAFTTRESLYQHNPLMRETNPDARHILPRQLRYTAEPNYAYKGWIPDPDDVSEVGFCLISSNAPDPDISSPEYYPVISGIASSTPGDAKIAVAVIVWKQDGLDGCASFSAYTEIVEYAWDIDGAGTYEYLGQAFPFAGLSAGEHIVTLRVRDQQWATAEVSTSVTIAE